MSTLVQRYRRLAWLALLIISNPARAQISIDVPTNFAGFSSQDLKVTIENIVKIILGFLGVLVVVAIIYGGFKIMISRGDADDTEKGRKIVFAGAIGLIIVLAAYAISIFVINSLIQAI